MSFIVLPNEKITFYHWGNSIKRSLVNLSVPTPPFTPENWRNWANLLISVNGLTYITLPSKRAYPEVDDWRKWAWLFIKNYNLNKR